MELKFLHSLQCKAILMKCLMVFILFRALGSFRISVATQKVSWFITSSNCFRLPLPIEESSLNKSSTYLRTMTKKLRVSSCTMTGSSQIRKKTLVMISITPVALFALIFLFFFVLTPSLLLKIVIQIKLPGS